MVQKKGLIVANDSLIDRATFERDGDVHIVWIPATEMAKEIAGTDRSTNMVMFGAFLGANPIVQVESAEAILRQFATGSKKALLERNIAALHAGLDRAQAAVAAT